jgi:hypothetical protein
MKCCRTNKIELYSVESHNIQQRSAADRKHGLPHEVKEIVENLIFEKNVSRPKKLLVELSVREDEILKTVGFPTLDQLRNYLKYRRIKLGDSNNMKGVEDFIKTHKFFSGYDPDKLFVFGEHLGSGSDDDHFYLGFTTLNLLKRIEYSNYLFHIDATYKIIKYLFPLVIFGFTDISRKFHVVAYMFVSHEQETDYQHFFSSLLQLTVDLEINLDVQYLVQDAWTACHNAVLTIFPSATIIMCWFHIMYNIKKHRSLIPEQLYESVVDNIRDMHYAQNEIEFRSLKTKILKNWRKNLLIIEFADYFEEQWLNGLFVNWQLFKTPAGKFTVICLCFY